MILHVSVVNGDGVGPEMMAAAITILKTVCNKFGHQLNLHQVLASGEAIEACNNPMPEESLAICKDTSAVLFGNTGLSRYQHLSLDKRPEYALMRLRRGMEVTTNIRPVRLYSALEELSPLKERYLRKGLDFVFVRDIVGGVFCSEKVKSQGLYGKEAYEMEYYNETIIQDTAKVAFELAMERKRKVINLDKSNVLESSKLWRKTIIKTGSGYPDVELGHSYIDAAAMNILIAPWRFDVMVTSNLFGDIISDEGTQITGTPYLYASAELAKNKKGIYTPNQLHHPDESIIGKQEVNPIGMIAAAALMLRHTFELKQEAKIVEEAIDQVLSDGYSTRDIFIPGRILLDTGQMAEKIAEKIRRK